jgi:hypothetical protein
MNHKKHWSYRNIIFTVLSIALAIFLFKSPVFQNAVSHLGNFGYVGAFIAGMLFTSTFTIAAGAVILLTLATKLPLIALIALAAVGAVVGDMIIFRFVKDTLTEDIELIYDEVDPRHHFKKVLHTKYFSWTLPVLGAIIIATPLPDEIGVSLMGISKMNNKEFIAVSILLHTFGITSIILVSSAL